MLCSVLKLVASYPQQHLLVRQHQSHPKPTGLHSKNLPGHFSDALFCPSTSQIFDIAPYGVPYALWGFIFVVAVQRFLLPGNSSRYAKDLLLAVRVLPNSPAVKKRLQDSGLLQQHGFTIQGLWRKNTFIR